MDTHGDVEWVFACDELNDDSAKKAIGYFSRSIEDKKTADKFTKRLHALFSDGNFIRRNATIYIVHETIERCIVIGDGSRQFNIFMKKEDCIRRRDNIMRKSCPSITNKELGNAVESFERRLPLCHGRKIEELHVLVDFAKQNIDRELKYKRRGENAELSFLVDELVFTVQSGEGAWKRKVLLTDGKPCITNISKGYVAEYFYEVDEINLRTLGKVRLQICGNEGQDNDPFLEDIRKKIETAITYLQELKHDHLQNMQLSWTDDDLDFYVVRAGDGKYKYMVSKDERDILTVDKEK